MKILKEEIMLTREYKQAQADRKKRISGKLVL